ncbi:MAG: outer membrane beta-barrel protein [Spirochaetes bacterium]|nr:outer membrane beta-barrel protein [Spirochaetota bacterium]
MKKAVFLLIAGCMVVTMLASEASARSLILKGGWALMRNDFSRADDTWTAGVFFDMGTFLFHSLRFKPGVDFVEVESNDFKYADIWGIHLDWYWYPMQNAPISPFLGFGPSLNYLNFNNRSDDDDSDAGVDLFVGASFGIRGTPLTVFLEARYRFIDIAARDDNILALNLGVEINF